MDNFRETAVGLTVWYAFLAILGGFFMARQVSRPLEELTRQVGALGKLEFDAQPVPHSLIREVDQLATATEGMKTGLRSFRKYVPADLVRALMEAGQEAGLGGVSRRVISTRRLTTHGSPDHAPGSAICRRYAMKAAYIESTGPPAVIKYGDVPTPDPKPGEIRVKVLTASVNPIDTYVRSGLAAMGGPFPFVTGRDFAGGEFVLTEQRPRMQSRAAVVPLTQGYGVVFAVNERPVQGTRGVYRVKMRHGVSAIRSGERHTLGIIFHDAA